MRYNTPLGRLGLACAAASLAALATAAPARAEEPEDFATAYPSMEYVVNVARDANTEKPIKITIENFAEATPAVDVSVKIDVSAVPAAFKLDLPGASQGCTVAGKVATCTLDELPAGAKHVYTVGLLPGDLDVLEYEGRIEVTTSGPNVPTQEASGLVQIAWPGIDLVIDELDDVTLAPRESVTVPVRAANTGTVAAAGVEVVLSTGLDLEFPDRYDNCSYNPDFLELTCTIPGAIAPGEVFEIAEATPLRVRVAEKAAGPGSSSVSAYVRPLGEEQVEQMTKSARGSGGNQLKLAAVPVEDLNNFDNYALFEVNIPKQAADTVAIGGTVAGGVGDAVDLKVGMRNDGPNNMVTPGEAWAPSALVSLPAGVKAVTVSDRCTPVVDGQPAWEHEGEANGLVYICFPTESLDAGKQFLFPFRVEIVDTASAPGAILADGGVQDPNTANNTAEITVGAGGSGGGLPVTGARAGLVAGAGALLVAAGAAAVVLLRRRRIVTVVD